jgi:glycerol-3-phosphate dehydrogenase (NAD(P)+)
MVDVAVFGAGSWGTALAAHLADNGHAVRMWCHSEELAREIRERRENAQYLPGAPLSDRIEPTSDPELALSKAQYVLSVLPSQFTRKVWMEARDFLGRGVPVLCASKGIERDTLKLMSQVFDDLVPSNPTGFIGGPSFAKEVIRHVPTAIVIASRDEGMVTTAQQLMSCDWMRAYFVNDVIGVEIGGSLKNVIAIACGCADGLGLGHNTRAAIITRGLAEMTRLAVNMGADPRTLAGLAGIGDLVLTCTGDLSRNRRVGLALGQGRSLQSILDEMGQVAEGVETTISARDLARQQGVEMPITEEVYRVVHEQKPVKDCLLALMRRELKHEFYGQDPVERS